VKPHRKRAETRMSLTGKGQEQCEASQEKGRNNEKPYNKQREASQEKVRNNENPLGKRAETMRSLTGKGQKQ